MAKLSNEYKERSLLLLQFAYDAYCWMFHTIDIIPVSFLKWAEGMLEDKLINKSHLEIVRKSLGDHKMASKHPGFSAVQSSIAKKSGVPKKAAGAILAASTRNASAKAKKANPRLKKVK